MDLKPLHATVSYKSRITMLRTMMQARLIAYDRMLLSEATKQPMKATIEALRKEAADALSEIEFCFSTYEEKQ